MNEKKLGKIDEMYAMIEEPLDVAYEICFGIMEDNIFSFLSIVSILSIKEIDFQKRIYLSLCVIWQKTYERKEKTPI